MLSRRIFLKTFLFFGSFSLVFGIHNLFSRLSKHDVSESVHTLLCNFFFNRSSAVAVGKEYLKNKPHEANKKILLDIILKSLNIRPSGLNGSDELRNIIKRKVINDFNEDEIVYISGWMLSKTEARLSALTVLCE